MVYACKSGICFIQDYRKLLFRTITGTDDMYTYYTLYCMIVNKRKWNNKFFDEARQSKPAISQKLPVIHVFLYA